MFFKRVDSEEVKGLSLLELPHTLSLKTLRPTIVFAFLS